MPAGVPGAIKVSTSDPTRALVVPIALPLNSLQGAFYLVEGLNAAVATSTWRATRTRACERPHATDAEPDART